MRWILPILMLCCTATVLGACSLPETNRPELDKTAAFPNLADVPDRPTTTSPYEREKMRQQLLEDNQAMGQ